MRVHELMSRQVHTCRSSDSLEAAAQVLWDHDIGAVPVVDDKGRVVGMLTDRDLCMAAYTQGRPLRELVIAETMSRELVACQPGDSLAHATALMKHHQLRRLPVLDEERHPVGIVTLADLAHACEVTHRGQAELASTIAAVTAPRTTSERRQTA